MGTSGCSLRGIPPGLLVPSGPGGRKALVLIRVQQAAERKQSIGNQLRVFIGRTDAATEAPSLAT